MSDTLVAWLVIVASVTAGVIATTTITVYVLYLLVKSLLKLSKDYLDDK